jgi:hypothetical protein
MLSIVVGASSDKDQHILKILNGQSSQQTEKEMLDSGLKNQKGKAKSERRESNNPREEGVLGRRDDKVTQE